MSDMTVPAAGLKILFCLFRNFFTFLKLHGAHLQRQAEQVDEARGRHGGHRDHSVKLARDSLYRE